MGFNAEHDRKGKANHNGLGGDLMRLDSIKRKREGSRRKRKSKEEEIN